MPRPVDWWSRCHDDEHEPRRDVLAESLGLHDRGAALVAEDLVGPAGIVRAEAEMGELDRPVRFSSGIAAVHNAASASGVTC